VKWRGKNHKNKNLKNFLLIDRDLSRSFAFLSAEPDRNKNPVTRYSDSIGKIKIFIKNFCTEEMRFL
jgi:hypothetical protein